MTPLACTAPTEAGDPCGICPACLEAQTRDIQRWGSPSDMDEVSG
jgi:hypothetical protein